VGGLKTPKKYAVRTRHFLLSWDTEDQNDYLIDVASSEDVVRMAVINTVQYWQQQKKSMAWMD